MLNREIGWKFVTAAVFFVLFIYSAHQIVRFTDLGWWTQLGLMGLIAIPFVLGVSQPLFFWDPERPYHGRWVHYVEVSGYIAINYCNDLIFVCLVRDIVSFFNSNFGWYQVNVYTTNGAIITLVLPLCLMFAGSVVVLLGPYVFPVRIRSEKIPSAFHGYRIVQLSDIHIGHLIGRRIVEKIVKRVNKLKPDLIVLTGDIIDGDPALYGDLSEGLRELQAKDGKLYVTGNHEYYWGVDRALNSMRNADISVLMNEVFEVRRGGSDEQVLRIAGIPDPSCRYFNHVQIDWSKVVVSGSGNAYEILLVHKPGIVKESRKRGFHLQLSGHTHAGQFFPWNLLIGWFQRYPRGLYKLEDLHLYVNQGTGFWGPPNRLGTWGEITHLVLEKPSAS